MFFSVNHGSGSQSWKSQAQNNMEEFNISRKKKVALCQNENQFSLPRLSTDVDVMQQINRSEIAEQTVQR